MRWSTPKLFNDPFEFPVSMDFKFTGEEIAHTLTEELVTMAYLISYMPQPPEWQLQGMGL